jgi:uncharacterized protein (TIGR03067 family)
MLPADPTLSVAERVDAACDRFEAEWKADRKPRIDDFLAAAPESDREDLRQALLALELELQGRSEADTSVSRSSVRSDAKPAPEVTVDQIQNVEPSVGKVGRFEILGVLGSGAFGKVYRAFDPHLSREVAVKVPLESTVRTDKERSQFLKEARSAANINHPNICQVHEVGEADGRPYIVMALVRGQSLADTLKGRKEPLPEKQAALVVRKIALALAAAHDSRIVHRDLKPANVMFDRERKDIVVMDFGLARGPGLGDARGTQSGVIMGTPAYMSPEQARGDSKGVGPAGDIFSLGVILYELLTGKRPFTGTATEVIGKILHVEPENPSAVRPSVDPRLEAICLKAMAKDTAARFASMKEFAQAIDTVLRQPAPAGPSVETAKANTTRRQGEDESTSTRNNLAEVFAVLSDDRKQARVETAAAVEAAIAKHRTPRWVFLLVGLFALGGFAALAGIVFFTRSDTVKVDLTVVLKDVDLADKSLTFFLNEEPISTDTLAKPVELKPGVHIFTVKRGKEIVKRVEIRVEGGRNPGIKVEDITPPRDSPPPVEPKKSPELKASPLDVLDAAMIPDAELNAVFGSRKKAPPELVAIYSNFLKDPRGDCAFWGFSLSSNGKILASSHYPYTIIEMHDLATGRKFGDAATKPGSWVQWCKISPDNQSIYYLGRDNKLHGADIRGTERWTRAVRSENWSGVALSPDGKTIIAADPDVQSGDVLVIDAKTGDVRDTWKNLLDRPIGRFEFTPDGQQVVVISGPGKFVSASNGQPVNRPELEGLSEARFSKDGKTVYGSRWFKQVEPYCFAYDLASGKKTEYRLAPNGCLFLTPNPVFPVLVTHDNVNELHFWDSNRGPDQKPVRIPVGDKVHRYEWTPEGRYLIVAIQQRVLVFRLPVDKPLSAWSTATATAKTEAIPDLERWQGRWQCVTENSWGKVVYENDRTGKGPLQVVTGNSRELSKVSASKADPPGVSRFRINETVSPKTFDCDEFGPGKWRQSGIYEFAGNRLRLVYRFAKDTPPVRATWTDIGKPDVHYYEFERIPDDGFVPLFNGKDLTGWKTHESQPGNWKVVDGVIVCGSDGTGPTHLYSARDDYKDFHFRMDVRVKDGSTGAMYRAPFGPTLGIKKEWVAGYNAKFDATRRGGIIVDMDQTLHRLRQVEVKDGEWAKFEIIARGNRHIVKLNGETTADYTDPDPRYRSGHIVLQKHGTKAEVAFRNIEIKELAKE